MSRERTHTEADIAPAGTDDNRRRYRALAVVIAMGNLVVMTAVAGVFVNWVPHFDRMFASLGGRLPQALAVVLGVSWSMRAQPSAWIACYLVAAVVTVALPRPCRVALAVLWALHAALVLVVGVLTPVVVLHAINELGHATP